MIFNRCLDPIIGSLIPNSIDFVSLSFYNWHTTSKQFLGLIKEIFCGTFVPNIGSVTPKQELTVGYFLQCMIKVIGRFRQALKNAMYCHLKSYSCTSSGTRILPESRNLWQYPSSTASTGINNSLNDSTQHSLEPTQLLS